MVTDRQVRRLFKLLQTSIHFGAAAAKADMDEKTARKYRQMGKLPSEIAKEHDWRTREDPFEGVWPDVRAKLETIPRNWKLRPFLRTFSANIRGSLPTGNCEPCSAK